MWHWLATATCKHQLKLNFCKHFKVVWAIDAKQNLSWATSQVIEQFSNFSHSEILKWQNHWQITLFWLWLNLFNSRKSCWMLKAIQFLWSNQKNDCNLMFHWSDKFGNAHKLLILHKCAYFKILSKCPHWITESQHDLECVTHFFGLYARYQYQLDKAHVIWVKKGRFPHRFQQNASSHSSRRRRSGADLPVQGFFGSVSVLLFLFRFPCGPIIYS